MITHSYALIFKLDRFLAVTVKHLLDSKIFEGSFTLKDTHKYVVFAAEVVGGVLNIQEDEIYSVQWITVEEFEENWNQYPVPESIVKMVNTFFSELNKNG